LKKKEESINIRCFYYSIFLHLFFNWYTAFLSWNVTWSIYK